MNNFTVIINVLQEMVWNIVHDCDFETAKSKTMDERYIFESKGVLHIGMSFHP